MLNYVKKNGLNLDENPCLKTFKMPAFQSKTCNMNVAAPTDASVLPDYSSVTGHTRPKSKGESTFWHYNNLHWFIHVVLASSTLEKQFGYFNTCTKSKETLELVVLLLLLLLYHNSLNTWTVNVSVFGLPTFFKNVFFWNAHNLTANHRNVCTFAGITVLLIL